LRTYQTSNELICRLVYASELFSQDTIARMAGHLRAVLEGMVQDAERHPAALPMLTAAEREQLLVTFNRAEPPRIATPTILAAFEATVQRSPQTVAVVGGGKSLTYAALNARANALAHALRDAGVGHGDLVAIASVPTFELAVALFATWKAGAAYVPVDPDLPGPRQREIARKVKVALVPPGATLDVTTPTLVIGDAERADAPPSISTPASPAYVLFTSGSTGVPKGVVVAHAQLSNYVHAVIERFDLQPGAYAFASTFSADLGNTVLFPPFVLGGTLHVLDEDTRTDGALFRSYMKEHAIDALKIVPSHFLALTEGQDGFPRTHLVFGGEAAKMVDVRALLAARPDTCSVFNHYGPTETTVGVLTFAMDRLAREGFPAVPLGRPLAGCKIYILDPHGNPTPVGVFGELHVGGAQVARAYLDDPAKTADRFVPDPFSSEPGARVYRTGDRARWLPSGDVDFNGRIDKQVKIRGYRVEPGEVEAVLSQHPEIREVVVTPWEVTPSDVRLVAYVVPREGDKLPADVRDVLKQSLPEYMIPSAFTVMSAIPLTPNGKVDRRALPAPELGASTAEFVELSTETQVRLAAVWKELLNAERIGAADNFFDLGGHSLLSMRMLARVARDFGAQVSIRMLFDNPRLDAIAAEIDRLQVEGAEVAVDPITVVPRVDGMPLSYQEEAFYRWSSARPGMHWNNRRAMRLTGPLDIPSLERAAAELVLRHENLRFAIRDVDGHATRIFLENVPQPLEVVELASSGSAEDDELKVVAECQKLLASPFDFAKGPLFKLLLWRLGPERHFLYFMVSAAAHIGSTVLEDLMELYAKVRGEPHSLPELPFGPADYAVWQRNVAVTGPVFDKRVAFWKTKLAGAEPLVLPTQAPRGPFRETLAHVVPVAVPAELFDRLKAIAKATRATPFNLMMAAFKILFHRRSGQTDLSVAVPVSNRQRHPELAAAVGNFEDHVVVRGDVSENPTFRDFLRRETETTFDVLSNPVPSNIALGTNAPLDHPLVKVVFNYLGPGKEELERPEGVRSLQTESRFVPPGNNRVAFFDLWVAVAESPSGVGGAFFVAADLFDRESGAALVSEYVALLETLAADPDQRVGRPLAESGT
jgi:amino acid adenylation domain-containing protein